LDNDGHLDVYLGTGDPQISRFEPNRLFRTTANGTFADLTNFVGLARPGNKGHGVAFVDIDGDGALDMFGAARRTLSRRPYVKRVLSTI